MQYYTNWTWSEPAFLCILVMYAMVSASFVVSFRQTSFTISLVAVSMNLGAWDGKDISTHRSEVNVYQIGRHKP